MAPVASRPGIAARPAAGTTSRCRACTVVARASSGARDETRRSSLVKLAGSVAGGLIVSPGARAAAEVDVLRKRRKELEGVSRALKDVPDNQLMQAEEYLLKNEIARMEANTVFLNDTRSAISSGGKFLQHAVLEVKDLDRTVAFWTKGLGMKVLRQRNTGGTKQAFVGYGPESLTLADGGCFALELIENRGKKVAAGENAGQYFQVALPNALRVSRLYNAGGEVTFGYGWFEIDAPEGFKVRCYVENRRDPFELVGVRVRDVEASVAFYEQVVGMTADREYCTQKVGRFEPTRPKGGVLMSFDDPTRNASVLLVPADKEAPESNVKLATLCKDPGRERDRVASLGREPAFFGPVPGIGTRIALLTEPGAAPVVFVDYDDFEKEQPRPTVLPISEELQNLIAPTKEE